MGELQLAPGEYALRTLVRNAATSEVGLRMLPLSVPEFEQSEGILLPPLVAEPAGHGHERVVGVGVAELVRDLEKNVDLAELLEHDEIDRGTACSDTRRRVGCRPRRARNGHHQVGESEQAVTGHWHGG